MSLEENQSKAASLGAIDVLMDLIKTHMNDLNVCNSGFRALTDILQFNSNPSKGIVNAFIY